MIPREIQNPDDVNLTVAAEMPGCVDRALRAGATPPFTYIGAGAYGIVLLDANGTRAKVGRYQTDWMCEAALTEFDLLKFGAARQLPVLRPYSFAKEQLVLFSEFAEATERPYFGAEATIWAAFKAIQAGLSPRFKVSECKHDSFVWTARGPILVDAGGIRLGPALLEQAHAYARGVRPCGLMRIEDLIWSLRMEVAEQRLDAGAAQSTLDALERLLP